MRFLLIPVFSAALLLSCPERLGAQMQVPPSPQPLTSAGLVGIVAAARGDVLIASQGQVGRKAGSGEPVYLGDEVRTDGEGQLQIMLLDESVFTIGPNSAVVIDTFIYDPATHEGKIDARVIQGVFRFITGQIAHKKPEQVEIKLPTGSVGVRGTIFYGKVEGNSSTLLLLGPGEKNNTGHRMGRIVVGNDVDGRRVETEVKKSGFGSVIEGLNTPPSAPFEIPKAQIQEMIAAVNPVSPPEKNETAPAADAKTSASDSEAGKKDSSSGSAAAPLSGYEPDSKKIQEEGGDFSGRGKGTADPSKGSGNQRLKPGLPPPQAPNNSFGEINEYGSATKLAGQDGANSYVFMKDLSTVNQINTLLSDTSLDASLDIGDRQTTSGSGSGRVEATFDQLRARVEIGTLHYEGNGTLNTGNYSFFMNVNFGSRTLGGGNSRVGVISSLISSGTPTAVEIPFQSFTGSSGTAEFKSITMVNVSKGITGSMELKFFNAGNLVEHKVSLTQSMNTVNGSGAADLKPGFSPPA